MNGINRRRLLQVAAVGSLGALGVAGYSSPGQANQSIPTDKQRPCLKGTEFEAKYSADPTNCEFDLVDGTDIATFTDLEPCTDEITYFEWDTSGSGTPIAVLTVREGAEFSEFEGVFSGSVSVDDPIDYITFCRPAGGRALIAERDLTGYDVDMHFDGDPTGGSRTDPVHVTSGASTTRDYAAGMVNVRERVGDLVVSDITTLEYDYVEDDTNQRAAPDEIFLGLLTDDDTVKVALTHVDDDLAGDSSTWRTQDVAALLSEARWSLREASYSDLTSGFVQDEGKQLRDAPGESGVSLRGKYGSAQLLSVGFGAGNTREAVLGNRYFDDLTVNGTTLGFPAVIPMNLVFDQVDTNTTRATLTFQQDENVVRYKDAASETIELNAFQEVVPPVERGLIPESTSITGNSIQAEFRTDLVNDVLNAENESRAIVSGDFTGFSNDGPVGSSFYGVGVV